MSPRPMAEIHEALGRILRVADGTSKESYMSIPARPTHDADLILSAALDELAELREANEFLEREHKNDASSALRRLSLLAKRDEELKTALASLVTVSQERDGLRAMLNKAERFNPASGQYAHEMMESERLRGLRQQLGDSLTITLDDLHQARSELARVSQERDRLKGVLAKVPRGGDRLARGQWAEVRAEIDAAIAPSPTEGPREGPKRPRCAHCGKRLATCIGAYEGAEMSTACDTCCGHGNEDGHCTPLTAGPTPSTGGGG